METHLHLLFYRNEINKNREREKLLTRVKWKQKYIWFGLRPVRWSSNDVRLLTEKDQLKSKSPMLRFFSLSFPRWFVQSHLNTSCIYQYRDWPWKINCYNLSDYFFLWSISYVGLFFELTVWSLLDFEHWTPKEFQCKVCD